METWRDAPRLDATRRRDGLDQGTRDGLEFWIRTASYAELEGVCELIREEIARRGQTFTWSITWPVVPGANGDSDGN